MARRTKELILGVIIAATALGTFWYWRIVIPTFIEGGYLTYLGFIAPLILLVAAEALFAVGALFITNPRILYPSVLIGAIGPFLFVEATDAIVALMAISALFIIWGTHRIAAEYEHSIGFSVSKVLKVGLPVYFTASAILISVFYFSDLTEDTAVSGLFPKVMINFTLKKLAMPIEGFVGIPKIDPEASVNDAMELIVKDQLGYQGMNVAEVTQSEIARLVSAQKDEVAQQLGISFNGTEKISDVFYDILTKRLQELLGPFRQYVPVASAVAFFLAFKLISIPLYFLSLFLAFLLIKFMKSFRILLSERKEIQVERLTL